MPKEEYAIGRIFLGERNLVPIDANRFVEQRTAREHTLLGLAVEERMGMVLENYREFEETLLSGALESLIYRRLAWAEMTEDLHLLNRRLTNLLGSARAYLDQTSHDLSAAFGKDSDELAQFKTACSTAYDSTLGCRVMEALRNHALHRGLALDNILKENWRSDPGAKGKAYTALAPQVRLDILAEDKAFKSAVLKEMKPYGDPADLRPWVREYVSLLVNVHHKLRKLLRVHLESSEATIAAALDEFIDARGGRRTGIAAFRLSDGQVTERIPLFEEAISRRKVLEGRYGSGAGIRYAVTTNEVREK